jgi:hypothetical protein
MFKLIKNWLLGNSIHKTAKEYSVTSEPVDPKTTATANGEPWVSVLETHVNPDNPRNGFFDLDWNEHFIVMLRNHGYTGIADEELVDSWFQDLCREIGNEEGVMMDRRFSGYINVNNLGNGKSEVS